ncbi:unnamed protein product [Arctogadus glacialis]
MQTCTGRVKHGRNRPNPGLARSAVVHLHGDVTGRQSPPPLQTPGADKERKGPDGLSALEAAETDAIKALLK